MSIKGKAAIIGFAEMAPQKEDGTKTPLGIISKMAKEAIADAWGIWGQVLHCHMSRTEQD